MEAKRLLRTRLLADRDRLAVADRDAAGAAIAAHGIAAWGGVGTVAAYASFGTEPPTRALLEGLRAAGVTVLLPVITDDGLGWASYGHWDDLVTGPLGIRQPAAVGSDLADAAVVVVP